MADPIERQAAIDAIDEIESEVADGDGFQYEKWRQYFCDLPSATPEQRWIPSGEKPPEEGSYLVWMPFAPPKHRMTVAKYCGGYWNIKTPISAWMPLPEPYREEGEKHEGSD